MTVDDGAVDGDEPPVRSTPLLPTALAWILRLATGTRSVPTEALPRERPVVFFANHGSHLDAPLIWAALPAEWRAVTRPVAARDYWEGGPLRRFLARRVFRAVLIERRKISARNNPLAPLRAALACGESLILFPEGTRSDGGTVGSFKSGLHHLVRDRPELPLVPVYLDNLSRILPKGELLPVPVIANLFVGAAIRVRAEEPKEAFLERARAAVLALGTASQP
ncbi:MAG: 1-acyl-sn-glycerol-3-phosphate acyltransferase [Opitutales bacterium]|nr:1-acyl-sn-glycerol-3-phosphate acyltransferase [Opitutales bacterium]